MKVHELISYLDSLALPDMEVIVNNKALDSDNIWMCHVANVDGHFRLNDPQSAAMKVLSIGEPNPMRARDAELIRHIGGENAVRYVELCRDYGVRHETGGQVDEFVEKVNADPPIKIRTTEM